ncbi:MAG: TIGR00282 family metallophosphoesterase [Candidatus Gracilibacteria bacterium]|nr:TIGR00282 family metallophosphoesterase [Candidatus Gracilibacteria bacterium]
MKILVFGDVYGRIGRAALKKELPALKEKYNPDFVVVNIENATSGRGPIEKHALEMEALGIDVMTSGDHIFDNMIKIKDYLDKPDSKLIRCANFIEYGEYTIPGKGYTIVEKNGKKLLVIHIMGEAFMKFKVTSPFIKIQEILEETKGEKLDAILVDFHKEATAEGYGLGFFLDGKVSFVFGTHTHVQTNDELILPNGTGIITDVGMNGPLFSVIGAEYSSVEKRFLTGIGKGKIEQCLDKNYVVNGVCVEIGDAMKCTNIEKIRIRGKL